MHHLRGSQRHQRGLQAGDGLDEPFGPRQPALPPGDAVAHGPRVDAGVEARGTVEGLELSPGDRVTQRQPLVAVTEA